MRKGIFLLLAICSLNVSSVLAAAPKDDVFKGKLFAPDVVLEHRAALELSDEQSAGIRSLVIQVQTSVAEHEWDMREAYQALMAELERSPIDESEVLKHVNTALLAENQVKKKQVSMLIQLKNLLTPRQVDFLESVAAKQ